ncbi:MAG TPA: hypothetical protein VH877_10585 [Polyangia bacterium]|jgi:1,4-dihydroxy-2-naphthoate octaprenyltransferase|nr:hypothetical protein [Polyangia bacterium]
MSALLQAHRILISAAIVLGAILIVFGIVHGGLRHEPTGWVAFGLGCVALPIGLLYLRKLFRNPPIR